MEGAVLAYFKSPVAPFEFVSSPLSPLGFRRSRILIQRNDQAFRIEGIGAEGQRYAWRSETDTTITG